MLSRYKIPRGPGGVPLPNGERRDIRAHQEHYLSPTREMVRSYLADPTDAAWRSFEAVYLHMLDERFRKNPAPFEALARLAQNTDVYLGCSCPTKKNPDVNRCHTVVALRFMKDRFPDLRVVFPHTE